MSRTLAEQLQEEKYRRGFAVPKPAGPTKEATEFTELLDQIDASSETFINKMTTLDTELSGLLAQMSPQIPVTSGEKTNVQHDTSTTSSTVTTHLEDIHMSTHASAEPTNGNTDPMAALMQSLSPEQRTIVANMTPAQAAHAVQTAQAQLPQTPREPHTQLDFVRSIDHRLAGRSWEANAIPIVQIAVGTAVGAGIVIGVTAIVKYFTAPTV